jgi:hypothetical protein
MNNRGKQLCIVLCVIGAIYVLFTLVDSVRGIQRFLRSYEISKRVQITSAADIDKMMDAAGL